MASYIDVDALIDRLQREAGFAFSDFRASDGKIIENCISEVKRIKAADVAPMVHGKWMPMAADGYADGNLVWDEWECSKCGHEHYGDDDTLFAYCPDCGAKMDLGE